MASTDSASPTAEPLSSRECLDWLARQPGIAVDAADRSSSLPPLDRHG